MKAEYLITMHCETDGDFAYRYKCEFSELPENIKWCLENSVKNCEHPLRHTLVRVEELPAWNAKRQRENIDNLIHRVKSDIHDIERSIARTVELLPTNSLATRPMERATLELEDAIVRLEAARDAILIEPRVVEVLKM